MNAENESVDNTILYTAKWIRYGQLGYTLFESEHASFA